MTDRNVDARPGIAGAGAPASDGAQRWQPTLSSRQVNWFEVYSFVERWATRRSAGDLLATYDLIPGTPQWCALPDDDARKLLALILGGVREALNHDVVQGHRADAGRQIADSQNWATQAKRVTGRSGPSYIARKAAS